jgi:hypothetical protein
VAYFGCLPALAASSGHPSRSHNEVLLPRPSVPIPMLTARAAVRPRSRSTWAPFADVIMFWDSSSSPIGRTSARSWLCQRHPLLQVREPNYLVALLRADNIRQLGMRCPLRAGPVLLEQQGAGCKRVGFETPSAHLKTGDTTTEPSRTLQGSQPCS